LPSIKCQLGTNDCGQPGIAGCLRELNHPIEPVVIGDGKRAQSQFSPTPSQIPRLGHTIKKGEC
jgi:hypothetical protein